jgi:hypothetical protein
VKITLDHFLVLADQHVDADELCVRAGIRKSRVYGLLRQHRPDRARKPRRLTSTVPDAVRALAALPTEPQRIAYLLNITPSYVYQILATKDASELKS